MLLAIPTAARADAAPTTTRVSIASDGGEATDVSYDASISADGEVAAFASYADDLVAGDTNGESDVFARDRGSGQTSRVSVDSAGTEGNGASARASVSADGRFVAFESAATNLVAGDVNGSLDVFVHDRDTGETTRVSVGSAGAEGDGDSELPAISADGRYVAFDSRASNLVAGDTNSTWDVFVHDRTSGETTRVSVATGGAEASDLSELAHISADGRFVAFQSVADNLVEGDLNEHCDAFVHDRQLGETSRVSVASDGAEGNNDSFQPVLSADGAYVSFFSRADNLVADDTNDKWDVFVHERATGQTKRVSVSSSGAEAEGHSGYSSISADGRYVSFDSEATNLVTGDSNDAEDIFVHDRRTGITERVSVSADEEEADARSEWSSLSGDGRSVAFGSYATNLVAGDTNEQMDVFVRDRWSAAPWDVNGDGVVNNLDVGRIGLHWLETGPPGWIPEDVNRDGIVNALDVGAIGLHWQETV